MRATWSLAAALLVASASAASALEEGEEAPEIDVSAWVQGAPIKLADGAGKKVFLVEFWATFDPDCAAAVSRLDALSEKYKAQGLEVIAISTEPADDIKQYVAEHKCGYRVASDADHNTVGVWAKDVRKYPVAWLVDRTGVVVWKGDLARRGGFTMTIDGSITFNRGDSLEETLAEVMSGKFDLKKKRELEATRKEMNEAQWKRDWDTLESLSDKALAADPLDLIAFDHRLAAYRGRGDHAGFAKFVRGFVDRAKDDMKILRRVATGLWSGPYEWRDLDLALSLAKRCAEAPSADAESVAAYAAILHEVGLTEQALAQQKKACALDAKDESLKRTLAYYELCLAAGRKAGGGK